MFEGLNATLRPIGTWPGEPTRSRKPALFSARWSDTTALLDRELRELRARNVVLQLDYQERDLRVDGMPRANARMGAPGVILAFDSKHGPLRYPCDRFTDWHDNVRAIALALEALRKVDRYGVTRRAEQYAGWRAISATSGAPLTRDQAAALLVREAGAAPDRAALVLRDLAAARLMLRTAKARAHPDAGGSTERFTSVTAAAEVLGRHHGGTL